VLRRLVFAAVFIVLPVVLRAQSGTPGIDSLADDRTGFSAGEVWVGHSASSPRLGFLGRIGGQRLTLVATRMSRRLSTHPSVAIEYTVDFIPLAFVSDVVAEPVGHEACICSVTAPEFPRASSSGLGVSPLGVTALFRRQRALQFRIGATGGFLVFDRAVPTYLSTHFNFTATLEAGAQFVDRSGRGVLAVYRFHHLSNAGTGTDNSGVASHVISIGARWSRKHR
jgi:hypothetical protein